MVEIGLSEVRKDEVRSAEIRPEGWAGLGELAPTRKAPLLRSTRGAYDEFQVSPY